MLDIVFRAVCSMAHKQPYLGSDFCLLPDKYRRWKALQSQRIAWIEKLASQFGLRFRKSLTLLGIVLQATVRQRTDHVVSIIEYKFHQRAAIAAALIRAVTLELTNTTKDAAIC